MIRHPFLLFCATIFLASCQVKPREINYGHDQCAACKMMITDARFGAELVTKKGKTFKYDALECMLPVVIKNGLDTYAFILATDFQNPGTLQDAATLNFLITDKIPSPMGKNLSAHKIKNPGPDQGLWYNLDEILNHFKE